MSAPPEYLRDLRDLLYCRGARTLASLRSMASRTIRLYIKGVPPLLVSCSDDQLK